MREPAFREIVYRLRPREGTSAQQLPLILAEGTRSLVVETRIAHLDGRGHIWRILHVRGPPAELEQAAARFRRFTPSFLLEKNVMGRTPHRLVLWYKYRGGAVGRFSHTAFAFHILGPDTVVTDETRAGVLTIRILSRAGPRLRRFLTEVAKRSEPGFDFELVYAGPAREAGPVRLRPDDEAALRAAWSTGFFDVPRRTNLRALAERLGASPSAVGYRLRRAQAALVAQFATGDLH